MFKKIYKEKTVIILNNYPENRTIVSAGARERRTGHMSRTFNFFSIILQNNLVFKYICGGILNE